MLILWLSPLAASEEAFHPLSRLTDAAELDRAARLVHDPDLELSPLQAIAQATTEPLRIDAMARGYWVVLPLRNDGERSQWRLSSYNTMFSRVDFHWVSDGVVRGSLHAGRSAPPDDEQPMLVYGWHFPFTIPPGKSGYLVHYVQTHTLNALILELRDAETAKTEQIIRQFSFVLMLGMLIALIVYNLFLSTAVRDLNYLWYSLHGTFLTLWFANTMGIFYVFGVADADLRGLRASFVAHELFAVVFCYRFLEIAKHTRILRRLFPVFMGLLLISLISIGFLPPDVPQPQVLLGVIFGFLLLLAAGLVRAWQGFRPARFYLLGWTGLSVGMIAGALGLLGVIPLSSYSVHLVLAASAFEMLFLALALADRIRGLQRDKGKAEAATEAQGAFIATVSHELRTPLHGILGLSRILAESPLDGRQKKTVGTIISTGHTLLGLINNILDYTRLTTRGMEYHREPFDPGGLVRELIALLAADAQAKGLELSCTIASETPQTLVGDQDRVRQVLLNLLSNAIKFTEQGRVELTLSRLSSKDDRVELRFVVSDTGIGIPDELKARLFQRFTQSDSAAGRRYGGAGLGLAICKELAEGMGGRIHFSSPPGGGSKFIFDLSLERPAAAETAMQADLPEPSGDLGFLREARILAVDDAPLNLFILEQFLKDAGSLVDLSSSGRDALAKASANPYDLILMDINMPEMDGITATRAIRSHRDPAIAATPIIGVTASVLPNERRLYIAQGMNAVLAKPFTQQDLRRILREVLEDGEAGVRSDSPPPLQALLDPEQLAIQRQDMGEELQRDLFSQFRDQGRSYLLDAEQAFADEAAPELRSHIHRLRGMAAMCGCARLAETAANLEQRLDDSGIDAATEGELERLARVFEVSADALLHAQNTT